MPTNKDRELQIELAKLQVDAQFLTTAAFGVVALVVTILVSLQQLVFSPSIDSTIKTATTILSPIVGGVGLVIFAVLLSRIERIGKQIDGLKNKFVGKDRPQKEHTEDKVSSFAAHAGQK